MRIRGSSSSSFSSHSSNSSFSLAQSTSSFISCTNSLVSSSSNPSSSIDYETRCEGLDLLVKAVLYVAGSVLGVPFTQKRVIRRRKRAFRFRKSGISDFDRKEEEEAKTKKDEGIEVISKPKKRKRVMALPSKYQDSVLQPWKRTTRRTQSMGIDGSLD